MDNIDLKIISHLGENSRISNREIARRIGIAEGTVRNRLDRLTKEGVLHTTALINIEKIPDLYIAYVCVKIDGRKLTECAASIEKLPSVLTTMIVTGRYDLFAVVLVPSHKTLVDFVTDQLSKVPGVRDSETFVVLRHYNQWIPADKLSSMAKFMKTDIRIEKTVSPINA